MHLQVSQIRRTLALPSMAPLLETFETEAANAAAPSGLLTSAFANISAAAETTYNGNY